MHQRTVNIAYGCLLFAVFGTSLLTYSAVHTAVIATRDVKESLDHLARDFQGMVEITYVCTLGQSITVRVIREPDESDDAMVTRLAARLATFQLTWPKAE